MAEVLNIVFYSGWTFIGTLLLLVFSCWPLAVVGKVIIALAAVLRGKANVNID